jgi:PKD repeat protein
MKTILSILAFACLSLSLSAQYCGSPRTTSTGTGASTYGFGDPATYSCITAGRQDSLLINFKCYPFFTAQGNTITVKKLHIDSIENLPCGMCWSSNKSSNAFLANETGSILIQGLTNDQVGQYKLRLIVSIAVTDTLTYTLTGIDAAIGNVNLYVRVAAAGTNCAPLDTALPGKIASANCLPSVATITASGPVTICTGDSVTLQTFSLPLVSAYHWSTGDTGPKITVKNSGNYTLTVYNGTDTAVSNTITVTSSTCVSATISAGGPTTFCQGSSVLLTANSGTGFTYHWSNGTQTQSIIVSTPGTYTLTVYHNGDSAVSTPITITVNPAPVAHFTLQQDTLNAHSWYAINQCSGNTLSYLWNWGDNSVTTTGMTPTHTYADSGYYTICVNVADVNGCADSYCDSNQYLYKTTNQMVTVHVVRSITGIEDLSTGISSIGYYKTALHFSKGLSLPTDIRLYDLSGRLVMTTEKFTGEMLEISEGLADGLYIVQLQNAATTLSKKIAITK